jgi:hypothetical protein
MNARCFFFFFSSFLFIALCCLPGVLTTWRRTQAIIIDARNIQDMDAR